MIRIAQAQLAPPIATAGALESSAALAADAVAETAESGADLLVLGELALGGYRTDELASGHSSPVLDGTDDLRLEPLRTACRRYATPLLTGAAIRTPDGMINGQLLIDDRGEVRLAHAKVHLWRTERSVFVPGSAPSLIMIAGTTIGLGICYDAGFPEYARSLARSADLLLFSSAFGHGAERHRYRLYHPARALESGVFVAVTNLIGSYAGGDFFGGSAVFDPWGRRLGQLDDRPGILITDIDPDHCTAARAELPYLRDLRPDYLPTLSSTSNSSTSNEREAS